MTSGVQITRLNLRLETQDLLLLHQKYLEGDLIFLKIKLFNAILNSECVPTCPYLLFQKGRNCKFNVTADNPVPSKF